MNQKEADNFYLKVADLTSQNSKARRLQVGAIIVKDRQIISEGYNGTPSGFDNNCEDVECLSKYRHGCVKCAKPIIEVKNILYCTECDYAKLTTKPDVVHAEANSILKCAKNGNSSNGGTIYVTHAPCSECSKMIIQAGIKRVVYRHSYRDELGINILKKANIQVDHIEE